MILINWKLRLKNKTTLIAIIGTIFLIIQTLGFNIPDNIEKVTNLIITLLVLLGVVNDPTTHGFSDSENAMAYDKPRK